MHRSTTRILTSHTGSLPRPPDLVDLYIRKGQGQPVDAELEAAARASMQDTIRRQKEAGIDIGNNGGVVALQYSGIDEATKFFFEAMFASVALAIVWGTMLDSKGVYQPIEME